MTDAGTNFYIRGIEAELTQLRPAFFEKQIQMVLWELPGQSENRIGALKALLTYPETVKILRDENPSRTRETIAIYNEKAGHPSATVEQTSFYKQMAELLEGALRPPVAGAAPAVAADSHPS